MKQISLTQGKTTLVDDDMFEELSKHKWYAHLEHKIWYAARGTEIKDKKTLIYIHRAIMNAQAGQQIDHRNNDGLDNRRCNLRFCTRSQNQQNGRGKSQHTSKYKGVSWYKKDKKWGVKIGTKYKRLFLGYFDNEIEAAKVYDRKAEELFGEFAYLNFK